eukprot:Skav209323  [mRNA]  locus=scaffold724:160587:171347:+ [translate_table: standard]
MSKHTCNFSSIVPKDKADMPHASSTKESFPVLKQSSFRNKRPQRLLGNSGTTRFTISSNLFKSILAGCFGLRRILSTSSRSFWISTALKLVCCAKCTS